MRGKLKCDDISSKPPILYDACVYGDWDGDFGPIVLDFESSGVCRPSAKEDLGNIFCSYKRPRFLLDDRYDWLFRQLGSMETHGESSVAASSRRIPYYDMDTFPYSEANILEAGEFYTEFMNHKKRRSGVQKRYAKRRATGRRVSSLYMDIGDCQWSCEHCKAKFWYGERLKGYSKDQQPHYHKCCSGGKVVLGDEREPPEYIKLLFGDCNFLDHIRVYNQMFIMTFFGARVDESINNRRGPYVFKISGQIYHWISTVCPFVGDPPRFLQLYIYDTENEVANRMRHFGGTQSAGLNEHTVEGLMHLLDECNELVMLFRTARDKCNGPRIILPTSFTGGPRYMYSHYLDALAICRVLGNPQYFITFTCNVNWPKIKRHMEQYPGLLPRDRADVVVRVFEQKVHDFCKYIRDTKLFVIVTGCLPHCHTLLWIDNKYKIQDAKYVDRYISAELLDPKTDPEGYRIISEMMVHGPCGKADASASCMKENLCSKKFPKKFNNETYFDKNGYVYYRRRDTGV
nr:helitron helicase-like domain-containing protein [Tanacetum cinerariifolium]